MIDLSKLILLSVWLTLVFWAVVEYNHAEHQYKITAPTIVVTPQSGE